LYPGCKRSDGNFVLINTIPLYKRWNSKNRRLFHQGNTYETTILNQNVIPGFYIVNGGVIRIDIDEIEKMCQDGTCFILCFNFYKTRDMNGKL